MVDRQFAEGLDLYARSLFEQGDQVTIGNPQLHPCAPGLVVTKAVMVPVVVNQAALNVLGFLATFDASGLDPQGAP